MPKVSKHGGASHFIPGIGSVVPGTEKKLDMTRINVGMLTLDVNKDALEAAIAAGDLEIDPDTNQITLLKNKEITVDSPPETSETVVTSETKSSTDKPKTDKQAEKEVADFEKKIDKAVEPKKADLSPAKSTTPAKKTTR